MKINALIPNSAWGKIAAGSALSTGVSFIIVAFYGNTEPHYNDAGIRRNKKHKIDTCQIC